MQKAWRWSAIKVVFTIVLLITAQEAHALPERWLNAKLEEAIQVARTDPPEAPEKMEALKRIAWLTHGVQPLLVSDQTIYDMMSLLDIPDDEVRLYIAGALGNLGPRARIAVPKLLAVLAEVKCLRGSLTSTATIRPALEKMGATLPPYPTNAQCQAASK